LRKEDSIKGDKLRDLILLVYLNNKYGLGKKIKISKLKEFLGYSTGGLYNALDESGFFIRKGDGIALSASGETYAGKKLLGQIQMVDHNWRYNIVDSNHCYYYNIVNHRKIKTQRK